MEKEKEVVTQAELVEFLAEHHDLPKAKALRVLHSLVDYCTVSLAQGKRVRLVGLGTLETHVSPARTARNVLTGEPVQVPEKRRVRLRVSSEMKRAINSGK
ncbi:HU family DNA-binding protein [Acidithiobacillus acidisediminis]|jgi:DNA-binding protein HU-beta|uniref:HU family DNA-binding protein n=1 Tax=Acidithiobacillus acidisediminis TaxID=2937799 RepID=UPI0018198E77|nr:HU family DNA-binding protein [Acidithiobacillus sp. S30A2]